MIRVNPNGLNVHQNYKYNNNKQNVIKNTPAFGKIPVSTLTHNQKAARIAEELATWVTTENPDSYPTIFAKILQELEEQIKTSEGKKGIEAAYEYIVLHQKFRKSEQTMNTFQSSQNVMSEILENSSEGRGFVLPIGEEDKKSRLLGVMYLLTGKTEITEEGLEHWCKLLSNADFVRKLESLSNKMMPYSHDLVNGFVKCRTPLMQVDPLTVVTKQGTSRFEKAALTVTDDTFLN